MLCFPLNHLISFCQSSSYDLRRSLGILCHNFNLTLTIKCETHQDSTFSDLKFSGYPSGVSRANDDVLLPLICAQYYTYNLYPHECLLQKLYCLYRTIIAKYPLCKLATKNILSLQSNFKSRCIPVFEYLEEKFLLQTVLAF